MRCPICLMEVARRRRLKRGNLSYACARCGHFQVDEAGLTALEGQPSDCPTPAIMLSGHVRRLALTKSKLIIDGDIAERLIRIRKQPPPKLERDAPMKWLNLKQQNCGTYADTLSPEGWAAVCNTANLSPVRGLLRRWEDGKFLKVKFSDNLWTVEATARGEQYIDDLRDREEASPAGKPLSVAASARLQELTISDFKCFKTRQRLAFYDNETGQPSRWTVLVGENGVGKTSILQLIAALYPHRTLGEAGPQLFETTAESNDFSHSLFSGSTLERGDATIECRYEFLEEGGAAWPLITAATSTGEMDLSDRILVELEVVTGIFYIAGFQFMAGHSRAVGSLPLLAGYGASRYVGSTSLATIADPNQSGIKSLFQDDVPLKNPEEWLLQADYAARFNTKRKAEIEDRLGRIMQALVRLLPGVSAINVAPPDDEHDSPYVIFETPYGDVDLSHLSFGYQSTIAWIIDFASRLFDTYPELLDPLSGSAIVLIDEIDLHVHPRWQRSIMRDLEVVFPNTQFVVTTHSPLVLQGSRDVNVALLQRCGDEVHIVNDLDRLRNWRVEQILTSDLFGLDSTAPDYVRELEKRRVEILSKFNLSDTERQELEVIDDALARLPLTTDPTGDRARRLILDFAAEVEERAASDQGAG